MSYDWNSFFGTFAQTTGAFIGIIAAFLISRIIGLTDRISNLTDEFDKLINKARTLKISFEKCNFSYVTKRTIENSSSIEKFIKNGEFKNLTDQEIISKLHDLEELYDNPEEIIEAFNHLKSRLKHSPYQILPSASITLAVLKNIEQEKDKIESLEVQVHSLIDLFHGHKTACWILQINNLKTLKRISLVLLLSFPVLVVYPLHFLPFPINTSPHLSVNPVLILQQLLSIKGLLLTLFLAITEWMFFSISII